MVRKKVENNHGYAIIDRIQLPKELKDIKVTKKLNVSLTFQEALRLNAAISDCVNYLNRLNFSTEEAKRFRAWVTISFSDKNIWITSGAAARKPRT